MSGLPLVVQLGFAGSRELLDDPGFEDAVERQLVARLQRLPSELGLSDRHFICGISQVAIGADTIFTRACGKLGWPQRIFLPQPVDAYLSGVGADQKPDFAEEQRAVARELLGRDQVIQIRVVSDAPDRTERFIDTNLELVRVSDLVVCLVRAGGGPGKPGGTQALIEHAAHRGRPVLLLALSIESGAPVLREEWSQRAAFAPPCLPGELVAPPTTLAVLPSAGDYCVELQNYSGRAAEAKQSLFKVAAGIIIVTHVLATLIAAAALRLHGGILPILLGVELSLLVIGFLTHQALHHSKAARIWAMSRLVAEVGRSGQALQARVYLSHLFSLPFPQEIRPLLRTLSILHLRSSRHLAGTWEKRRAAYVKARIGEQLEFYRAGRARAARWSKIAGICFGVASVLAIVSTGSKLASGWLGAPPALEALLATWLGTAAIVLPVIAVAAVSLAASFGLDARIHTYGEMDRFLATRQEHLKAATSERAFVALALETEARLLGENVGWYYRHAFAKVT